MVNIRVIVLSVMAIMLDIGAFYVGISLIPFDTGEWAGLTTGWLVMGILTINWILLPIAYKNKVDAYTMDKSIGDILLGCFFLAFFGGCFIALGSVMGEIIYIIVIFSMGWLCALGEYEAMHETPLKSSLKGAKF